MRASQPATEMRQIGSPYPPEHNWPSAHVSSLWIFDTCSSHWTQDQSGNSLPLPGCCLSVWDLHGSYVWTKTSEKNSDRKEWPQWGPMFYISIGNGINLDRCLNSLPLTPEKRQTPFQNLWLTIPTILLCWEPSHGLCLWMSIWFWNRIQREWCAALPGSYKDVTRLPTSNRGYSSESPTLNGP